MLDQIYATVLITGGAGFVGSNLAVAFKKKYPALKIICLDNLKRRGSEITLQRLKAKGIAFMHGDIRNPEDLDLNTKIDLLIECSAEPSVLAGYGESPAYLINTNLVGTINCLNMAHTNEADVIFLSTSRVYPAGAINTLPTFESDTRYDWIDAPESVINGWSANGISENFSLSGARSLYGATKLCSELILQEYASMYGLRSVINRCGVIAGPWQFGKVDQGICTYWLLSHYFRKKLCYIGFNGQGKQVRDILHVDDLFDLLEAQLRSFEKANGNIYNIGGGRKNSVSLQELSTICAQITENKIKIDSDHQNRPNDIIIYITDNQSAHDHFGWQPRRTVQKLMEDIYNWTKSHRKDIAKSFFDS